MRNYDKFKQLFKLKYWSEPVQNIIRDDICHGRYDSIKGQTPTAYFLGKVCVAKYLDPKISEECLVTKRGLSLIHILVQGTGSIHYVHGGNRSVKFSQLPSRHVLQDYY